MAKKTTKKTIDAGFQNIASKAAAKVATDIFKKNPDIKEAHITADGTAFYGRNDAQNHANTLANREVFSFKCSASTPEATAVKTAAKSTASTTPAPASNPATTDKPGDEDEIDELGGGDPINNESDETTNTGE